MILVAATAGFFTVIQSGDRLPRLCPECRAAYAGIRATF
jgi:hypothetical protein